MPKKPKPKIEEVAEEAPKIEEITRAFGKAHAEEANAKNRMAKFRKQFFELIEFPETQLARQTIYAETEDPEAYVAALYPKWKIVSCKTVAREEDPPEYKMVIQEDPEKKNFVYVNRLDGKVYSRTVAESAPDIDLEKMKAVDRKLYDLITFQPDPPPRQLKPLGEIREELRDEIKKFLIPGKLTNTMNKPRPAKPEELEG